MKRLDPLAQGTATNDDVNARVSRTADLVVSRSGFVLSVLAAAAGFRLLGLSRDACPSLHTCGYVVFGAVAFFAMAVVCAVTAFILRPPRTSPPISTELPNER